jgi:GT2 family glycosyltransferase
MKLSVIVATRNRAPHLGPCLDSIAAAFERSALFDDAEIVIADNGSTDETPNVLKAWAAANTARLVPVAEPRPGKSRALNRAIEAASGELLAFTDDDCRLLPEYVNDLLRHDAADAELVLRGGRIELGDPTDLPLTINTAPTRGRWSLAMNSARHNALTGKINGCNMMMRRALIERIGGFDEDFGPGSKIASGDDTEFVYRAYTAGVPIEYVPDMAVAHFHGRKTAGTAYKLWRGYATGNGAFFTKYLFKHFNLARPFWWDIKNAVIELRTGTHRFEATPEFSYVDKVRCQVRGALMYIFMRHEGARKPLRPRAAAK